MKYHDITDITPSEFFRGQFTIVPRGSSRGLGNPHRRWDVHEWTVITDLPVCRLRDRSRHEVGIILGWAYDLNGLPISDSVEIDMAADEFLYTLGGRYMALLNVNRDWRFYLDPMGTLSTVFRSAAGTGDVMVASTTSIAYVVDDRPHPIEPAADGYRPAGLTAVPDMTRLLPNHYFSLTTRSVRRHHFVDGISREAPTTERLEQSMRAVRSIISGTIADFGRPYITLTGGRDSRMILAAAEPLLSELEILTLAYGTKGTFSVEYDVSIAKSLAKKLDRPITIRPVLPYDERQAEHFLWRTGAACRAGKAKDFYGTSRASLRSGEAIVVGFGGEVSRATNYYRSVGRKLTNPPDALGVIWLKPKSESCEAMARWLSYLDVEGADIMEMLYFEHRMACWAAPQFYGFHNVPIVPFAHRLFVDTVFSLPVDYKRSDACAMDIVRSISPKVASIGLHNRLMNPLDRFKNRIDLMLR